MIARIRRSLATRSKRALFNLQARAHDATAGLFTRRLPAPNLTVASELHGVGSAGYRIAKGILKPGDVVYSFGVGCDITFDLSLIAQHGVGVHAFDPTIQARAFIEAARPDRRFAYHQWALAPEDGPLEFEHVLPEHPSSLAGTVVPLGWRRQGRERVEGRSLRSIMAELGHEHLGLVKLDIEGGEYGVIEQLASCENRIGQLVLEFHPFLLDWSRGLTIVSSHGWDATARAIERLLAAGFSLFAVSGRGTEYSFLNRESAAIALAQQTRAESGHAGPA